MVRYLSVVTLLLLAGTAWGASQNYNGRLGGLARELSFTRTLIVADQGIVSTGYVATAATLPSR